MGQTDAAYIDTELKNIIKFLTFLKITFSMLKTFFHFIFELLLFVKLGWFLKYTLWEFKEYERNMSSREKKLKAEKKKTENRHTPDDLIHFIIKLFKIAKGTKRKKRKENGTSKRNS